MVTEKLGINKVIIFLHLPHNIHNNSLNILTACSGILWLESSKVMRYNYEIV